MPRSAGPALPDAAEDRVARIGRHVEQRQHALVDRAAREGLSEVAIRTIIQERAAPAAAPEQTDIEALPGVKAWPKPNDDGVYEAHPDWSFAFTHAQIHRARIDLLQISHDTWIRARDVRHGYGSNGGPLGATLTFRTPMKAFADAALSTMQVLSNLYLVHALSWGPSRRRSLEVAIEKWSVWIGETALKFATPDEATALRERLSDQLGKLIVKGAAGNNSEPAEPVAAPDDDDDDRSAEIEGRAIEPAPPAIDPAKVLADATFCVVDPESEMAQLAVGWQALRAVVLDLDGASFVDDPDNWTHREGTDEPWHCRDDAADIDVFVVTP